MRDADRVSGVRRRARAAVLLATATALVGVLAGCGTATLTSPPAGVDGLTIPTPSLDPDEFAARVDNPWFPLEEGQTRNLGGHSFAVLEPTEVAGVSATPVRFTDADDPAATHIDLFAQDHDGNVWWVGRDGGEPAWRAGEDGAQAGLFLAATPRLGDGYRTAYLPGIVEERAEVVDVEDHTVEVRFVDDLSGAARSATFAHGEGLVELIG